MNRRIVARVLLAATLFTLAFLLVSTSSAKAAPAVDLPGIDVCPKDAPFAVGPESGLAGLLGERPIQITNDIAPEHIWSTAGFAGMRAHTYDLGCAIDPTSWMKVANASADAKIANMILSVGDGIVSLTDSVDRRAWRPGWIISFLEDFAGRAARIISTTIIGPFLAVGGIVGVTVLVGRAHRGDMTTTAANAGWMMVVLTISSVLLLAPLYVATMGQAGAGALVAGLNNGANPTDATTNQIVKNVQYQGWLRRNFGNKDSLVAREYGPKLLASMRISWAEQDAILALDKKDQPKAIEELTDRKAKEFKDVAEKVKELDKGAYRHLTGEELGSTETFVELLMVLVSCGIRLAVAVLMIACEIILALLSVIWLIMTAILLIPRIGRFSGQELGMGLIDSGVQALKYVLVAAVGSWLFGLYLQACMAPGMSLWWSLLLLTIGTGVAWTLIRPDRKFLSIVSLGRVQGYGYVGSLLKGFLAAYVGGKVAGAAVAAAVDEKDEQPQPERMSEDVQPPAPRVVYADVFHPAPAFMPDRPTTVDADPLPATVIQALPADMPVYERPVDETPAPPPDAAESPYEPYERSDDNEGARQ